MQHSFLFVPGNRPERFIKALDSGADAIIIDLEDAVADAEKAAARTAIMQAVFARPDVLVYVRINAVDTPWFLEDLTVLEHAGICGVFLPKAEYAENITQVRAQVRAQAACRVIPIIETATGLCHAQEIARASGVERLAFGSMDFQLDMNCDGSDTALLYARSQLVVISRWAGLLAPIDGVTLAMDDESRVVADARHAKALGMGGKLCIHPRQVGAVNTTWQPMPEEILWARKVLAAGGAAGANAVAVDGVMIDRPLLHKAQRILSRSQS
ncbi:aldolase [Rugosibacter aromaticivorans]|uniref:Aldolase n=1 Tax=Rugosibacter aromaticivorans TaxID=1565605 RepID=A0A0C5JAL9_9PROT|nr:CoA ester lyase [Rugosibacter aromaticivorans]AJP48838.1 aldolase [Rugosibacter aromaticivorans]TBR16010.1 MAG: CoA ester lyase [Rugosibacter sp.]